MVYLLGIQNGTMEAQIMVMEIDIILNSGQVVMVHGLIGQKMIIILQFAKYFRHF